MPPGPRGTDRDAQRALDAVERRLARFDRQISLADWASYQGRGNERTCAQRQSDRARYLRDPRRARLAESLAARFPGSSVGRQAELLRRIVLDSEVEQAPEVVRLRAGLQGRIVRFRPMWHRRRVGRAAVQEVLWSSPDRRERHRAWAAEEPLRRSLEPSLRRLIGLRNDLARDHGFPHFAAFRLAFEHMTAARVRGLGREAIRPLAGHVRQLREEFVERSKEDGWAPWDLRWAIEQRSPLPADAFPAGRMMATVDRALGAWGLPPERRRFRIVRCDIPFGGLTLPVQVPNDVRVLVHPRGGWEYYCVLFHELGHAVHLSSISVPHHLERTIEPGFAAFAEGIATIFERVADDPNWLSSLPGISPALAERFAESRRAASVFYAAGYLLGLESELRLYERPDLDPAGDVCRLSRQWFGYDTHAPGSWGDPFRVTHPMYVQSYLLAYLFRAQVTDAMLRETRGPLWPNPRAGPWLTRALLRAGSRYDWLDRVEAVTGAALSAEAFVRSVGRAS
jgi:hypothetical protein